MRGYCTRTTPALKYFSTQTDLRIRAAESAREIRCLKADLPDHLHTRPTARPEDGDDHRYSSKQHDRVVILTLAER
jgi:hypothetical protein